MTKRHPTQPRATRPPGSEDGTAAHEDPGWRIFHGDGQRRSTPLPKAPPWRGFRAAARRETDTPPPSRYVIGEAETDIINAALHLRRPLLVTGHPGVGKTSLAQAIAHELDLGPVVCWPINSRSTLQDALYRYDAIGRLHESSLRRDRGEAAPDVGDFIRLGPVGTALVAEGRPRVLLVDELDKGDMDLPNDLLTILEEGVFEIPELSRLPDTQSEVTVLTEDRGLPARIRCGLARCAQFPVVVLTSNGERDFPPAFRRRCLPLHLADPDEGRLRQIITNHLGEEALTDAEDLVTRFLDRRTIDELATDQLLNAVFLRNGGAPLDPLDAERLIDAVFSRLNPAG